MKPQLKSGQIRQIILRCFLAGGQNPQDPTEQGKRRISIFDPHKGKVQINASSYTEGGVRFGGN